MLKCSNKVKIMTIVTEVQSYMKLVCFYHTLD